MRRRGSSLVLLAACLEFGCIGGERPPLPTIAGPEAEDLVAAAHGYVLRPHRAAADGHMSEIALTAMPSLGERVIRPPREKSYEMVDLFSGPDERGRIAYVQTNGTGDTARLNTINADGSDNRVIMEAVGPQYQVFGTHPALAPSGGAIAFMSNVGHTTMDGEYLETGTLAVWRAETSRAVEIATSVDDRGVAWFPDGVRLAYVSSVPRQSLGEAEMDRLTGGAPDCRQDAVARQFVPLVYLVDVRSGVARALHAGMNPVVSTDGAAVLLECASAMLVDTSGVNPRGVTLPGDLHRPLALIDGRLVLYWALPTQGTPVLRSPHGSFGAGTQLVTIKIADLATGRFQTVIPAIDPRWEASFGQSKDVVITTHTPATHAPDMH